MIAMDCNKAIKESILKAMMKFSNLLFVRGQPEILSCLFQCACMWRGLDFRDALVAQIFSQPVLNEVLLELEAENKILLMDFETNLLERLPSLEFDRDETQEKLTRSILNKLANLEPIDNSRLIDSVISKNSIMLLRHFSIQPFKKMRSLPPSFAFVVDKLLETYIKEMKTREVKCVVYSNAFFLFRGYSTKEKIAAAGRLKEVRQQRSTSVEFLKVIAKDYPALKNGRLAKIFEACCFLVERNALVKQYEEKPLSGKSI
ncbi:hypothetical protein CbuD7D7780_05445 [Coxiella burnetii]|nr:hypothetical protein [Coxiella burnetii]OYK82289.1 hypothetical protein CbuD7D7780_05445 [Coxiella burnetii]